MQEPGISGERGFQITDRCMKKLFNGEKQNENEGETALNRIKRKIS